VGDRAAIEREAIDGFFRFSPTHARELRISFHEPMSHGGDGTGLAVSFYLKRPCAPLRDRLLELRYDTQRRADYPLKRFHDAFLGCGQLPILLIRQPIT
jgi:hypothetical protein